MVGPWQGGAHLTQKQHFNHTAHLCHASDLQSSLPTCTLIALSEENSFMEVTRQG